MFIEFDHTLVNTQHIYRIASSHRRPDMSEHRVMVYFKDADDKPRALRETFSSATQCALRYNELSELLTR